MNILNPFDNPFILITFLVKQDHPSQTMNHPVDQVINPTITPAQVHPNAGLITSTHIQGTSISTLFSTIFYSTAPHVPHDPIGTSLQPIMQTSTSPTQPAGGNPPSNEPFPPRGLPFHGGPTHLGG
jgi:hypothetical protein